MLSSLHIYPVKSLKGLSLQEIHTTPKGPGMDRRWMVVDRDGRYLTQRIHPKMALIAVNYENNVLTIIIPGCSPITLVNFEQGSKRSVTVWKDTLEAVDQGDHIAEVLSTFLSVSCRLVFMPDSVFRRVDQDYSSNPLDDVSFADGFPFLLTTEASLDDLNLRLSSKVLMNRFRPNLVIAGCEPFEEDNWKTIKIGTCVFKAIKPCARCRIITVDPDMGIADPKGEPLVTLSTYRKREARIIFGQNLVQTEGSALRVGDPVQILEKK